MEHSDCRAGMRVRVNTPDNPRYHRKTGTIMKVNPVNIKVQVDDLPRALNAHPSFLEPATGAPAPSALDGASAYAAALAAIPPPLGAVVEHTKGDARIAGPHVVIGETTSRGHTMVRIAKLGGDGNRYWRVSPTNIRVIEHFNLEVL